MAIENLFDSAPNANDLVGKAIRLVNEQTTRSSGHLVVTLHRKDFFDLSVYTLREITGLRRENGGALYHDNGVVHTLLQGNFRISRQTNRELCFPGAQTADAIIQHIRTIRDCGYDFPYDLSALSIQPEKAYVSVIVPEEQVVRDTTYHSIMRSYIRRTRNGLLLLPCPTVYYASTADEAQETLTLLKQEMYKMP